MLEQTLWVEKYRPHKIDDCILPDNIKQTFQSFVDKEDIPNLLLSGGAGCGKTTVARAMLEEIECDYIFVNASLKGNIDTLRNEISQFASSVSFTQKKKFTILDEADNLTDATQKGLRGAIEEFSSNHGFIFTCNYKNKIIEPIHSRCSVVDMRFSKDELLQLAGKFLKRACNILEQENVKFDKKIVAEVIKKHYPDWRRVLNELQRYSSATGEIDSGILSNLQEISINSLMGFLKEKDFTNVRKWVAENVDNDADIIYRKIYDHAQNYVTKSSIPSLVLILGKYGYQHSLCADQEVNLAAALVEMICECEFS